MDYKLQQVAGTSYVRSSSATINNTLDGYKGISFYEERVTSLDNGTRVISPIGVLDEEFTPLNSDTVFSILDPVSGEPTGGLATYADVYQQLFSLYYAVANKRDIAAQELTNEQ